MLGNWIKETTTTSGTGNITLAGAVTGFATFDSQFPNATLRYFNYLIEDGNNREYGVGHLTASTTLVRDKVVATLVSGTYTQSNDATKITLSGGTSYVYCDIGSEWSYCPGTYNMTTEGVPIMQSGPSQNQNGGPDGGYQWCWPFTLPLSGLYSGIRVNVVTTNSGSVKVGVYDVALDGKPDRRIANRATGLTVTTGIQTISFDANVFLLANKIYYLGWLSDNTITYKSCTIYGASDGAPVLGVDSANSTNNALYISQTYSSGLLTPFSGSPSRESGGRHIPLVTFVRV